MRVLCYMTSFTEIPRFPGSIVTRVLTAVMHDVWLPRTMRASSPVTHDVWLPRTMRASLPGTHDVWLPRTPVCRIMIVVLMSSWRARVIARACCFLEKCVELQHPTAVSINSMQVRTHVPGTCNALATTSNYCVASITSY